MSENVLQNKKTNESSCIFFPSEIFGVDNKYLFKINKYLGLRNIRLALHFS
jgi:hypothetical protein